MEREKESERGNKNEIFGEKMKLMYTEVTKSCCEVGVEIGVMTNMALVSAKSHSPHDSSHPLNNYIYTRESSIPSKSSSISS